MPFLVVVVKKLRGAQCRMGHGNRHVVRIPGDAPGLGRLHVGQVRPLGHVAVGIIGKGMGRVKAGNGAYPVERSFRIIGIIQDRGCQIGVIISRAPFRCQPVKAVIGVKPGVAGNPIGDGLDITGRGVPIGPVDNRSAVFVLGNGKKVFRRSLLITNQGLTPPS